MQLQNDSNIDLSLSHDGQKMELYSIVLSATMLFLAILFGGGGCVTVLIAMCAHKLMRKLRYILLAILLTVCCVYDFIWCPIEITRLVLHHQNFNRNNINEEIVLKRLGSSLYVLLLSSLASIIVLISIQNLLKLIRRYDGIPRIKFGTILIFIWLFSSVSFTIAYVVIWLGQEDENIYHSINRTSFNFKIGLQAMWIILALAPIALMVALHLHTRYWNKNLVRETSDLQSNDNFTVPSLIIKSVEEINEEDEDENSVALPSPDIHKDSCSGSPTSKCSKSALKKRSGSPSSQKVLFADEPSPTRENGGSNFGDKLMKSSNHLGVNMAAILGRRRHTIAQISEPHLDLIQKAKSYNYVRKFSVDISALQAQLENPKIHGSFPFHSQQDIKTSDKNNSNSDLPNRLENYTTNQLFGKRSRDDIIKSQDIAEEPEHDHDTDHGHTEEKHDNVDVITNNKDTDNTMETQSIHSQCQSVRSSRSARDSICPTPPLISLTQSDGEEKQLEMHNVKDDMDDSFQSVSTHKKLHKPCKMSCLLVATFICSILPMFLTELLRDSCLSPNAYINIITCMTSISVVQTMIYPQLIFCVDERINKAVHQSFLKTRRSIMYLFHGHLEVSTNDDISDTEV